MRRSELLITYENINSFRDESYLHVHKLIWKTGLIDQSVLRSFPNLREFVCWNQRLTTLEWLVCFPELRVLNVNYNCISSLKGIEHCPKLEQLCCGNNRLTSLAGTETLSNLRDLDCQSNSLDTLEEIEGCPLLERLSCSGNKLTIVVMRSWPLLHTLICFRNRLTTLEGIDMCTQLQVIHCYYNKLATLRGINNCLSLRELYCNNNNLVDLRGLENCLQLGTLDCSSNQITRLDQLVYLRHLRDISYSSNPLELQTAQVQRRLGRHNQTVNRSSSIYADRQNVHDIHIQKTVCESIQRLLLDPKPEFSIEGILGSDLNQHTKQRLVEYCSDETVHSQHLLTYAELLSYVWARIDRSEHKDELVKILEEQIQDAECMCFTGRFNRTLSVLVGFYEDIVIEISDSSRISAIVLTTQAMVDPYDPEQHRVLARHKLLEAGYSLEQVQPWLDAISEP